MPGSFNPTQPPNRPGIYVLFQTRAAEALSTQEGDTLALPITAEWGPDQEVVSIDSEHVLNAIFHQAETSWEVADALRGGAGEVLAYRMVTATGNAANLTITSCGVSSGAIYFEAAYMGEYGNTFQVEIADYLPNSAKDKLTLYASGAELEHYTYDDSDWDQLADKVNASSSYITASALLASSVVRKELSTSFTTGRNGETVGASEFGAAWDALRGAGGWEVIAIDSDVDSIHTEFVSFVQDMNDNGEYVHGVYGCEMSTDQDDAVATALTLAALADYEHVTICGGVNIIDDAAPDQGVRASQIYSTAEMAPRVAGIIANARIARGVTFRSLGPETDVHLALDDSQLQELYDGGVVTFAKHSGTARIEHAITTFTSFTDNKDKTFASIRAVRVMEQIGRDVTSVIGDDFIGVKTNTPETRLALLKAIQLYLEGLAAENAVLPNFVVELDPLQDSETGQSIWVQIQLQFGPELLRVFLTITSPTLVL